MTHRRIVLVVAALLAAGIAAPSSAITWLTYPRSFDEVVEATSLAFRGTVIAVSDWTEGSSSPPAHPYTRITFRVNKAYAGCRDGDKITLRQAGGRVPGTATRYLTVPGFPGHRVGDETIIFANDTVHPLSGSLWGDLGTWRVARAPDGKRYVFDVHWKPLVSASNGSFEISRTRKCGVDPGNRAVCREWTPIETKTGEADFDPQGNPIDPTRAEEKLVSVETFDAKTRAILEAREPMSQVPQTVTKDDASFRAFLDQVFGKR